MIRQSILLALSVIFVDIVLLAGSQSISYGQCVTPNGEQAACVQLQACKFLYDMLLKTSLTEQEKQFLSRSQCGQTNESVLICCPVRYLNTQPSATTVKTPTSVQTRNALPEPGVCGISYINRILGGNRTEIDEYPWMALIEYDRDGESVGHRCAGSLINERYILTSAHCVVSIPSNWAPTKVRLGEWDTSTNPDCIRGVRATDCNEPHVEIPIEKSVVHPKYSSSSRDRFHDIALLRLAYTANYTDFIKPICLPVSQDLRQINLDAIMMDIAGWGRTERGQSSNIKLKATVAGVPLPECQQVYVKRNITLIPSQLCAGGMKGTDTCSGDSGGPLIARDVKNKRVIYFFIAGVVSYGPNPCGLEGWPGVYTRVSDYVDWIQENIEP